MTALPFEPHAAPRVRASVLRAGHSSATLVRVGPLTSYLTETIVEDALAGGPGGRVEIELTPADGAHLLRTLRLSLGALAAHGIVVEVHTASAGRPAGRGESAA
jgi:hypothetical protein